MTSEHHSAVVDNNNFSQIPECQTLDSLLQTSIDASNQSDLSEKGITCDKNILNNVEPSLKRSWTESVDLYINSLKPKDTIIFIENMKVFSNGTDYMTDFRNHYFDNILKFLNGGEPLKTDFGRDEYTSLYSLYSFSAINSENKEECLDTPMIFKIMERMDTLNFTDRNLLKISSNMKTLLLCAKDIFLYYNKLRNNHHKRKRYLIIITCSDMLIDDASELIDEMKAMKVRFSLFSPVKYESHLNICELLNYNTKGCKDLSCYYSSPKWLITLSHGLNKAFESNNVYQNHNKKIKWNSSKEIGESTEYDFISAMGLGNVTNISSASENVVNQNVDIENALNNSITGRPIIVNDPIDQNYKQNNLNSICTVATTQLSHSKSQSKFLGSNTSYYSSNSINQSQINKINQIPYFYGSDPLYSAPNSVNVSSHRSTPSSIPHSQSPQFHMGNNHPNILQPPNSVPEIIKPNSVESCSELHGQLNSQLNVQKSIQINQDTEIIQNIPRFPFANNMYSSANNTINTNNLPTNRFINRPSIYQSNIDPRNSSINLFDGYLIFNDEFRTEFRINVDQTANLNLLCMESWDHSCIINYINYIDSYDSSLYGKTNTDIDLVGNDCGYKGAMELQIKMSPQGIDTIFKTLTSKHNSIGIVRPNRTIPSDVHVQMICFLYNRLQSTFKVLLPADPKGLLNEIKNRMPAMHISNQAAPIYNQLKRNNIVPNQQVYNVPQNISIPMNRYSNHNSAPMSIINNQVYRNIQNSNNFINNHQIQANPNYILHQTQYPSIQNQPSNHMISMDMGIQSNQSMYDQNSYGLN